MTTTNKFRGPVISPSPDCYEILAARHHSGTLGGATYCQEAGELAITSARKVGGAPRHGSSKRSTLWIRWCTVRRRCRRGRRIPGESRTRGLCTRAVCSHGPPTGNAQTHTPIPLRKAAGIARARCAFVLDPGWEPGLLQRSARLELGRHCPHAHVGCAVSDCQLVQIVQQVGN